VDLEQQPVLVERREMACRPSDWFQGGGAKRCEQGRSGGDFGRDSDIGDARPPEGTAGHGQPASRTLTPGLSIDDVPAWTLDAENYGAATTTCCRGDVVARQTEDSVADTAGATDRGRIFKIVRDQRVAFLLVGGLNTVLGTGWFIVFQLLFDRMHIGRFDYMISLVCAQAASIMCSFIMQRTLVFRVHGNFWLDFVRFASVSMSALGINLVLLPFFVEVFSMPKIPAQLLATAIIAVSTYFAHREFSFRRKRATTAQEVSDALAAGGPGAPQSAVAVSRNSAGTQDTAGTQDVAGRRPGAADVGAAPGSHDNSDRTAP